MPEKFLDIFLLLSLFNCFKFKSLMTPLIFIFITYYYLAKKTLFLKQISYIFFIIFMIDFVLYFQYCIFETLNSTLDF